MICGIWDNVTIKEKYHIDVNKTNTTNRNKGTCHFIIHVCLSHTHTDKADILLHKHSELNSLAIQSICIQFQLHHDTEVY